MPIFKLNINMLIRCKFFQFTKPNYFRLMLPEFQKTGIFLNQACQNTNKIGYSLLYHARTKFQASAFNIFREFLLRQNRNA